MCQLCGAYSSNFRPPILYIRSDIQPHIRRHSDRYTNKSIKIHIGYAENTRRIVHSKYFTEGRICYHISIGNTTSTPTKKEKDRRLLQSVVWHDRWNRGTGRRSSNHMTVGYPTHIPTKMIKTEDICLWWYGILVRYLGRGS